MFRTCQAIVAMLVLASSLTATTTAQACDHRYQPRTVVAYTPYAHSLPTTTRKAPATARKAYVHYVTKYDHYGNPYRAKVVTWKTVTIVSSHHRGW